MKQLKDSTNCHMAYFPHFRLQFLKYIPLIVVKSFIMIKTKVPMCLYIYSVSKYLSISYLPGTGDTAMNNPDKNTCPNGEFRY